VIFDEIAEVMHQRSNQALSNQMGLSRNKIARMTNGLPFNLDYNTVFALRRMGYEIRLDKGD
jgi:hypothetical protein